MVPVAAPCLMWVQVGEEAYYDDSNGILRSAESTHRMIVPMEELDREKKYTICYRKIIERKPYFTETEAEVRIDFEFRPVQGPDAKAYHIADAHNHVEEPVAAAVYRRTGQRDGLSGASLQAGSGFEDSCPEGRNAGVLFCGGRIYLLQWGD